PLAGAVRRACLERARERRARGPAARAGVTRRGGSRDGAAGHRGRLDRGLQEILSYRSAGDRGGARRSVLISLARSGLYNETCLHRSRRTRTSATWESCSATSSARTAATHCSSASNTFAAARSIATA